MLKKRERLTRAQFDQSFALGKRLHSPVVQIIYHPSDTFHGSAVVGKKVAKKAVDRNTLRRRLYGLLYSYVQSTPMNFTVIMVAKPGALQISRKQFAYEVRQLLDTLPKARV
jgi:ribonuclease P protein component